MDFLFQWKVEDGEIAEGGSEATTDAEEKGLAFDTGMGVNNNGSQDERKLSNWSQRDGNQRPPKQVK